MYLEGGEAEPSQRQSDAEHRFRITLSPKQHA